MAEALDPELVADLEAKWKAQAPPSQDIVNNLEEQWNLRKGDYSLTSVYGLAQAAAGVTEVAAQMGVQFAAAVPGAVAGAGEALLQESGVAEMIGREDKTYADVFHDVASLVTWESKTVKGKKYGEAISNLYVEYMEDGLSESLKEKVRDGKMTPLKATAIRTLAEAALLVAPIGVGKGISKLRAKNKAQSQSKSEGDWIDIDAEPLEGDFIPKQQRGGWPEDAPYEGNIYDMKPGELPPEFQPKGVERQLPGPDTPSGSGQKRIAGPDIPPEVSGEIKLLAKDGIPAEYVVHALERYAKTPEQVKTTLPAVREAWHGSPVEFWEFSSKFIGEGEGAQVKGHGLYFSSEKSIAKFYKDSVSRSHIARNFLDRLPENAEFSEVLAYVGKEVFSPNQERVIKALAKDDWLGFDYPAQAINTAYSKNIKNYDVSKELLDALDTSGHIYKVQIPHESNMLDWDKPMSEQTWLIKKPAKEIIAKVKAEKRKPTLVEQISVNVQDTNFFDSSGEGFYISLVEKGKLKGDPKFDNRKASELLRSEGILGITYKGTSSGERNFVVFDDASINTISRSGVKNPKYQGGAIDFSVFAEGIQKLMLPGINGVRGAASVAHELGRQFMFRHSADIRRMPSETAKTLANKISPDSGAKNSEGYIQKLSMARGDFNTRLESIVAPMRTHAPQVKGMRLIAIPKRANDAVLEALNTGKLNPNYAHLEPEVRALRQWFKSAHDYAVEAGVDIGELPNYFPHLYNAKAVASAEPYLWNKPLKPKGGKFTKYLMEEEGLSYEAAQNVIVKILKEDGWLEGRATETSGRLTESIEYGEWNPRATGYPGGESKPGPTRSRKLNRGEWSKKKEWLITDLESVLHGYVRVMTERAEYVRLAGPKEQTLNKLVKQIIDENVKEGYYLGPHKTAERIYDLFDALQHRFKYIEHREVRKLNSSIAAFEVMAHMSRVALAQVPETFTPIVKYRMAPKTKSGIPIPLKSHMVALAQAFQDGLSGMDVLVTGSRHIPKAELKQILERIGVSFIDAQEASAARFGEGNNVGAVTHRFMKTTGMEIFTDFQRRVAADTIISIVRSNAKALSDGSVSGQKKKMFERELEEFGIDKSSAIEWYESGMPSNSSFSRQLDNALVRGINETIIMPDPSTSPVRFNDPRFTLPLQFTRFFTAFGNTFIRKVFDDFKSNEVTPARNAAGAGGVAMMVAGAYFTTMYITEKLTGYSTRDEDDPMRIVDAVDRSGLFGVFTRFYPLMVGEYKYKVGKDFIANLALGPAGNDLAKLIDALKTGNTKQKAKTLAQLTPIANSNQYTKEELVEIYEDMLNQFGL